MPERTATFTVAEVVKDLDPRLTSPEQIITVHLSDLLQEELKNPHRNLALEILTYIEVYNFLRTGDGNWSQAAQTLEYEAETRETRSKLRGYEYLKQVAENLKQKAKEIREAHPQ